MPVRMSVHTSARTCVDSAQVFWSDIRRGIRADMCTDMCAAMSMDGSTTRDGKTRALMSIEGGLFLEVYSDQRLPTSVQEGATG